MDCEDVAVNPEEPSVAASDENTCEASPADAPELLETQIVTPAADDQVTLMLTVRDKLVSRLFAATRPTTAEYQQLVPAYQSEVAESGRAAADDFALLLADVRSLNAAMLETEKGDVTPHAEVRAEFQAVLDSFYAELNAFTAAVEKELVALDAESPEFAELPEEQRTPMMNTRRGVEIIHRMLSRTVARRKDPTFAEIVVEEALEEPAPPDSAEAIPDVVGALYKAWHQLRDKNYDAVRDAKQNAEKARETCVALAKSVLGAIDGIDSGLEYAAEENAANEWSAVYSRLSAIADAFFANTGMTPHATERGVPFDPDTMEPQSAVEDPELPDEAVAAMVRRGFSFRGMPVRPVLVNVVRNS